jgi:lipopolysaccharide export system protein LptA
VVLRGAKGARLVTQQDTVTADQQLEYWQNKRMAVARGNAVVVHKDKGQDKILRAHVLTALFKENRSGKTEVYRVEAFDGVRIDTGSEVVTANKAVYNVESGIATLTGSVKITRGPNELNGCAAEVNLNTGISRIQGCGGTAGGGDGRVRGTLTPSKR